jgi:hypothetical protein
MPGSGVRVSPQLLSKLFSENVLSDASARTFSALGITVPCAEFKVDFKREEALKALAADARKSYVTYETVESE